MKTNIASLMNVIASNEKKLNTLRDLIDTNIYTISIEELNGNINIIEDTKEEFSKKLKEYEELLHTVTNLKSILYEKNNQFKLSDGRTIQEAIIDNTNLRKLQSTYENMLISKNSKRRITEVNNSYFEIKTLNFDREEIENKLEEIINKINNTDFEISKLNSNEFEI